MSTNTRRLFLIPALVLALVVVAAGGLSFVRKARTFQPLGFTAESRAGHWLVTGVESEDSELLPGDRILLLNGREFGEIIDPEAVVRSRTQSELVVMRGDSMESASHLLPSLEIDYAYLVLTLIGLTYLFIGCYTLYRDQRRPSHLFFIWALTSALLYLASPTRPFDDIGKSIYLLDELARLLLPPLTLHLFAVFPNPLARSQRLSKLIPFLYLPTAFLIALQTDLIFFDGAWLFSGAVATAIGLLDRFELYYLVIYSLAAAAVLTWRLARTRQQEPFRQASWIAIGMAAGYLPFLAMYVLPHSLGLVWPKTITTLAVLPLGLVPLTFAYAILRYKLWDIGIVVRDTAALMLTVLVGVLGFSIANLVIARAVPEDMAFARTAVTFISGLVIAGLMVPTRKTFGTSLERLQYRSSWGRRRALSEFGREILQERSLGRLCTSLLEQIQAALDIPHLSLFLSDGTQLLPFQPQRSLPPKLSLDEIGDEFWDSEAESLVSVEFPSEDLTPTQRLFTAGYRYAMPLRVRDHRIGVLLTGYKEDDVPLSSDDIDLVRTLLNQAALAVENAQLLAEADERVHQVTRMEEFTSGIIESSPAGIAVVDSKGLVRRANQALGQLIGIAAEQLVGEFLRDHLPIEKLPKAGKGLHEMSLRGPDGEDRYLQLIVAPLAEASLPADPLRVVVIQDVSERVQMENDLKQKERLASLGMLAAGVAHEVNTPITGISSYAQMLLDEIPEDDPKHELLRKVEKQTFRAANIVRNLLEFSRDKPRDLRPLSPTRMMAECLDLLEERLDADSVTVHWKNPSPEARILGDEGEIQQVFTNLVVNAIDAMNGSGQLSIDVEADENQVWISIEDTGPGITPAELEKIFQPFFSTKLAKGGTGLGLSISFNIVRRHGGEIRVVSNPGEGSRFIVELPRHQPAVGESE